MIWIDDILAFVLAMAMIAAFLMVIIGLVVLLESLRKKR